MTLKKSHLHTKSDGYFEIRFLRILNYFVYQADKSFILWMIQIVFLWLNDFIWSIIVTDQPYIKISIFGKPYNLEIKL